MPLIRLLAAGVAGLVLIGPLAAPAAAATTSPAPTASADARTSAAEARRVDRVRTPTLRWYKCYSWAQCATTRVPLDYDHPYGAQTTIALLRVKARDRKHRIGSLFVNPGGPGAPATDFALLAPLFLSDKLLDRFDIVGMDPRGIASSTNVECFSGPRQQTIALKGMEPLFPYGKKQEKAYVSAAKTLGRACSTHGRPLSASMSTAEVARDMDVMRRAVGDKKLTYLGFSYGTAIGQYYANMFPDRFRAIAADGVINPQAWVGSRRTGNTVQDDRLRSADGAYKAFAEIMRRCAKAGTSKCVFAGGDPMKRFATITRRLKAHPVVMPDLLTGGTVKETYADFIGDILDALYLPVAGDLVAALAQEMWELTSPGGSVPAVKITADRAALAKRVAARSFPYNNALDAYASVMCSDGRHPKDATRWPALAAKADKRAPYFGRAWAWASVQCARSTWTARDEDAYTGPFTRHTANPVLLVGSYWDPATNYRDAVKSSHTQPGSRLLSSNNWGHTAYGTSACATGAIDGYLLHRKLPAKGKVCVGDDQPFTTSAPDLTDLSSLTMSAGSAAGAKKELPPIDRSFR